MIELINRNIKIYYEKYRTLIIFLLFFPHVYHMILPNGSIAIVEFIFVRLRLLSLFLLLLLFFSYKRKPSKLLFILAVLEIWVLISTLLNNPSNSNKAILYVCSSFSIAMIVELNVDDIKKLVSGLLPAFELHIYPNLLTVLLYRNISSENVYVGYHENNFFLGTKNDLILYLFPAFCLCILYYLKTKKVVRPLILSITIILTILLSGSVTTLIAFALFIAVFVFIYFVRKNNVKCVYLYVLIPILFLLIVVLPYMIVGKNVIVDFIMDNIYYRHSFISRTAIWVNASEYVKIKPITGYGYINTSLPFVDDVGRYYYGNAHCDLIQRILNYGLIGLILFISFNILLLKKVNSNRSSIYKTLFISFICAIYITFISQTYHRFFEFYLILFLANNIEYLDTSTKN